MSSTLAKSLFNGEILDAKPFDRRLTDELQRFGFTWCIKVPGEHGHKALRMVPPELGDYIDGDDGQQIVTPQSMRYKRDDLARKDEEYNERIESDCGKACQIFYSHLGPDALDCIKTTKDSTNLSSRDKAMVLLVELRERFVGNSSTTRDALNAALTVLPQIFDRQTAMKNIVAIDDINGTFAEMRNPVTNELDRVFVKPDADLVSLYLKLYIGTESFRFSIEYLKREKQNNHLTWDGLKAEVIARCQTLKQEEDAALQAESFSVRAVSTIGDVMANPTLRSEFEQRVADGIADGLKQVGGSPGFIRGQDRDFRDGGGRDRSRDRSNRSDRYDNRDRSRGRDQNRQSHRGDRSNSRGRDSYRRSDDYNRGERRDADRFRDNSRDRGRDDRNRGREVDRSYGREDRNRGRDDRSREDINRDDRKRDGSDSGGKRRN